MTQTLYKRLPSIILLATFTLAVVLSFLFAQHRYKLLDGNNIDYSYLLQFTVKAFSPTLVHEMSVNPYGRGESMLFTAGFDGAPSLWHWMHFEPVKIIPTYLYSLTGSLLVPYAFYIFFFFLPLLYGAYLLWNRAEERTLVTLALIAAATYFGTLFNAVAYLRPWPMLMPIFLCFILSLIYRRPLAEKIFFTALFLIVREEAMILTATALMWETLRNRRDGVSQRETKILWGIWAAVVAGAVMYIAWTGYEIALPYSAAVLTIAVVVALCIVLPTLWWLWQKGVTRWPVAPNIVFGLATISPILFSLFFIDPHARSHGLRIIYHRFGIFLFYIIIGVFLAYIYDHRPKGLEKRIYIYGLSLCIALFIAYEVLPHQSATINYVRGWDLQAKEDALVYRAEELIPKNAPVLLDKVTIVAFAERDNTYAYNYLPAKLASTTGATFPENIEPLKKLIATKIPYAVLNKKDADPLLALIRESGQTPVLIEENTLYAFYEIK